MKETMKKGPEVTEKPVRTKFSVENKLLILRLADQCVEPEQSGRTGTPRGAVLIQLDRLTLPARRRHLGCP